MNVEVFWQVLELGRDLLDIKIKMDWLRSAGDKIIFLAKMSGWPSRCEDKFLSFPFGCPLSLSLSLLSTDLTNINFTATLFLWTDFSSKCLTIVNCREDILLWYSTIFHYIYHICTFYMRGIIDILYISSPLSVIMASRLVSLSGNNI